MHHLISNGAPNGWFGAIIRNVYGIKKKFPEIEKPVYHVQDKLESVDLHEVFLL